MALELSWAVELSLVINLKIGVDGVGAGRDQDRIALRSASVSDIGERSGVVSGLDGEVGGCVVFEVDD